MKAPNKIFLLMPFLFAIAVFSLGMSLSRSATNYYVSPTGSDSNPGSRAAPFKTIQKAANVVAAGDVVHVAPGTYTGIIRTTKSGTATKRIRFVSSIKWGAKCVPPSGNTDDILWENTGEYVDIDGFELDGSANPWFRLGIAHFGGYGRFSNNLIHHFYGTSTNGRNGNGGAGILSTGTTYEDERPNEVFNNVIHHIGDLFYEHVTYLQNHTHGIYVSSPNCKVYNNIVYANEAYGIHLYHNPRKATVANNLCFNNGAGGFYFNDADSSVVVNNISYDNPRVNPSGKTSTSAYSIGPGKFSITFRQNLSFKNGGINSNANASIIADPGFVNYKADGTGDYHLVTGSPGIDQGIATNAPSFDHDGIKRPKGAGYDIGPYEQKRSLR
jgi:hypothetical protein